MSKTCREHWSLGKKLAPEPNGLAMLLVKDFEPLPTVLSYPKTHMVNMLSVVGS